MNKSLDDRELEKLAIEKLHRLAYKEELNVFKVLSNVDHEIRHSSFLAWLLDPEENHGFGSEFAVKFFHEVFKDNEFKSKGNTVKDWEKRFSEKHFHSRHCDADGTLDTYIDTEKPVDPKYYKNKYVNAENNESSRRIDIFVKGKDFTCTIENKTFSDQHDEQLAIYKSFVEAPENYGKLNNFFVYLGIDKPPYFDLDDEDYREAFTEEQAKKGGKKKKEIPEETANPYKGYTFVSYKTVIDILNSLKDKEGVNPSVKEFIEQYLVGLGEFYGKVDEKTEELCNKILKKNKLAEKISEYDDEKLTPKLRAGKEIFRRYAIHLQKDINDEFIRERMENIMLDVISKEKKYNIIEYHYGRASKADPYAYTLRLDRNLTDEEKKRQKEKEDKVFIPFQQLKEDKIISNDVWDVRSYIKQIDYRAKLGIFSILFLYGSSTPTSRTCFNYICNHGKVNMEENIKDFCIHIQNDLIDKGWEVKLEYAIKSGAGFSTAYTFTDMTLQLKIENRDQAERQFARIFGAFNGKEHIEIGTDNQKRLGVGRIHKSELLNKDGTPNEELFVFKIVREMFPDEYNGSEDKMSFKDRIVKYLNTPKSDKKGATTYQGLNFMWSLVLTRNIFDDKDGRPIITEEDRNKIEGSIGAEFYKRTKEGLALFKLEKSFMEKLFKSQNDCE